MLTESRKDLEQTAPLPRWQLAQGHIPAPGTRASAESELRTFHTSGWTDLVFFLCSLLNHFPLDAQLGSADAFEATDLALWRQGEVKGPPKSRNSVLF